MARCARSACSSTKAPSARISCSSSWSRRRAARARTCRYSANTAYINTIPPGAGRALAGRPRARAPASARSCAGTRWRWCVRANKESSELGGHIASFASAATLYDVGFNHFLRAANDKLRRRPRLLPGPLGAGRLRARVLSKAASPKSSSTTSARKSDGKGLSSYPHPWLMPDFWQFPTVSMGLGPLMAIYQARFMQLPAGPRHRRTPRAARSGRSWATARWTSRNRSARSRSRRASSSTT